jgi:DNA-binding LacI/PurR family transcriptional regulator
VTIREVAQAAGVHHTTVSRALRNHPALPPETRKRVQAVARKLGYRLNPLVSAWMAQRKSSRKALDSGQVAYLSSHPDRDAWRAS